MKGGLTHIPSPDERAIAYEAVQHFGHPKAAPLDLHLLALYTQWTRFDPRLAEICVLFFVRHWKELLPLKLREELLKQPWPGACAVLLEFSQRDFLESKEKQSFKNWRTLVTQGFPKSNEEQYFIGLRPIASIGMVDDARLSLAEYRKWGFLAREVLFNKQKLPSGRGRTHTIEPAVRREILKELLRARHRVTAVEYQEELGQAISLRQAERDLKSCALLRPRGNTRGRTWVKR